MNAHLSVSLPYIELKLIILLCKIQGEMSADEKYFSYCLDMSTEKDWTVCVVNREGRRK